jgi:hypothetical protein
MKLDKFFALTGLLVLSMSTGTVFGQAGEDRHPKLQDNFLFSAGAFVADKNLTVRVDGSTRELNVDFDERVGLSSDETTASAELRWRFGEKWSVSTQYFKTSDVGRAELTEDIHWDDYVLKVGSNVGAGIGLSVARVFFGREMSAGPRHEFGVGLGLHWLEIDAFVEGEFFLNDESTGFRQESVSAGAPLPNIGAWYWYALSPRWLLTTRLDWFGASIGDYSGDLWNAGVGINFQAWRHVGLTLSYQLFNVDVEVRKTDWRGGADLTYHGPFLAVSANW